MSAQDDDTPPALIVAGPTASGKSALALALAERLGGAVINADSMQVYRDLRILTARPTAEEEARVPHLLYGVRDAAEPASAGWWRREALASMRQVTEQGRVPVLCGGTGLWLAALANGIGALPAIPDDVRGAARTLEAEIGAEALHARLAAADPETAARLEPGDSQRVIRAWEVLAATGRGLAAWWREAREPPAPYRFAMILLKPPRAELRAAIDARFLAMIEAGALEEVRALAARRLDPALPAMKAHGVPNLAAALAGRIPLAQAIAEGQAMVRQYAKRQDTWFRHQEVVPQTAMHTIHARFAGLTQLSEQEMADLFAFIDRNRLTHRINHA
ncbi:tRNA (adenosine(37)-N6)-dimethylallyltransferase MiaA [Elioraea rosea]|uniref:tRNA (adenosine(37)-N6)-dimethylallyltransferase MiaA n=1 Tax=Elioraea rosea TaxID=2492390 RepID=UPI001183E70F|nr:tRNA (adenosine(37)-N6)-dimethylallyltransferase MiaA [Elioraea rosea]